MHTNETSYYHAYSIILLQTQQLHIQFFISQASPFWILSLLTRHFLKEVFMLFDFDFYINKFNALLTLRDLTRNTVSSYLSMLRFFLTWCSDSCMKRPEDTSFEDIRSYLLFLKEVRLLSNRSINAHISQIRFLFLYVLGRSWDKYQVPYMKFHSRLPDILSLEQVNTFIDSIPNIKHQAMIALLYASGLRVSELCHLKYQDVQRQKKRLYISSSKSRSDRFAILSDRALDILTRYWLSYNYDKDWLFPGRGKEGHVTNYTVARVIDAHTARLGWDIHINCHMFRHSFGTHLYENGYDLLTIQKLLGHISASSSLIYVSLGVRTMNALQSPFDFGRDS